MTAQSQKTVWNVVILAAIGIALWKLWPTIKKAFGGSSTSNYGGAGASASQPYPYEQQQTSPKPTLPGINFGNSTNSFSGGGGGLKNFINSVLNQGYSNAQNIPNVEDAYLGQLDQQGIPLEPVQQLTDLPSYTYDDPNAPWNQGSDVSNYSQLVDPSGAADSFGVGGGGGFNGDPYSFDSDNGGDGGSYDSGD